MSRVMLEGDRVRAEIVPGLGAGLAAFDVRGPDGAWWGLLRRAPDGVAWFNDLACYLLAPWPNRIADGRFLWRGNLHAIRADWSDGTAIHGLVKDKAWRLVERTPVSAALEFDGLLHADAGWPWPFTCRVRYELMDAGLAIALTVRNGSAEPMPAGLGFHPFFVRSLWDPRDEAVIRYAARGRYPAARMIPTGPAAADDTTRAMTRGLPLRDLRLDDVFEGSTDSAEVRWPASGVRARFECSSGLGHGVVYTGEPAGPRHGFFCFEPVSMVNNGFNLAAQGMAATGVVELGPGQALAVEWLLRIDRI